MRWLNKLAFRIWLAINGLVITGILVFSSVNYMDESSSLETALRNEGITAAKTFNSAIGLYMLQGDYSQITPLAYSMLSQPNIKYVIVRDTEGHTVNQKGQTNISKDEVMIERVTLEYFQEKVGEVEIAINTATLNKQTKELFKETLIISIALSLISIIFSTLFSRRLIQPINRLIEATKKMSQGERNVEVEEDKIIEIQQLAVAFNRMTQKINNHEEILVDEIKNATMDLSEKIATLEALGKISSSVLEDDIMRSQVLTKILESIKENSKVDRISLALMDKSGQLEVIRLGHDGHPLSFNVYKSNTPLHKSINEKNTIIQNNPSTMNLSDYGQQLVSSGMKSLLVMPIIAKNNAIGTLNIASSEPYFFTGEKVEKLSVFTTQIALALDRITAYESLQYLAYHDYLTELPNYRLFKNRINDAIEQARRNQGTHLAILFFDLDRFKMINDTLGHSMGDLLLKQVSKQILNCIQDKDTVARFGGDEFAILLPNLSSNDEAITVAKRILHSFETPFILKGYEIQISASIGISHYPSDGRDASKLIRSADRAMYRARELGKGNFAVYNQSKDDQSVDKLILENDMRKALKNNEFIVYYQPKIDLQSGTVSGLEALVRWMSPHKGIISPAEFIPLAEETGLIVQIGEYVLRDACKQVVYWQEIGLPAIPVSVNLSIRQLLQSNLVNMVRQIIIDTGIAPELVELEITESMSMDIDNSIHILNGLKSIGVRISVDDFGTGYSSLNYLRQLPVDRVKIDQSFIKGMTQNPSNEAIVATIITMAHNLKLTVTAEGVETEEQVKYLEKYACDEIQGFYFSKPLSTKDFESNFQSILKEAQKWKH